MGNCIREFAQKREADPDGPASQNGALSHATDQDVDCTTSQGGTVDNDQNQRVTVVNRFKAEPDDEALAPSHRSVRRG